MSNYSNQNTPRSNKSGNYNQSPHDTPVSTSRRNVSRTPGSARPRKPLFDDTPPIERHMIHIAKNREIMAKNFRREIRNVFHESDAFAFFQQQSALVIPPELTPQRYILGKYKMPPELIIKKDDNKYLNMTPRRRREATKENTKYWVDVDADGSDKLNEQQTHPSLENNEMISIEIPEATPNEELSIRSGLQDPTRQFNSPSPRADENVQNHYTQAENEKEGEGQFDERDVGVPEENVGINVEYQECAQEEMHNEEEGENQEEEQEAFIEEEAHNEKELHQEEEQKLIEENSVNEDQPEKTHYEEDHEQEEVHNLEQLKQEEEEVQEAHNEDDHIQEEEEEEAEDEVKNEEDQNQEEEAVHEEEMDDEECHKPEEEEAEEVHHEEDNKQEEEEEEVEEEVHNEEELNKDEEEYEESQNQGEELQTEYSHELQSSVLRSDIGVDTSELDVKAQKIQIPLPLTNINELEQESNQELNPLQKASPRRVYFERDLQRVKPFMPESSPSKYSHINRNDPRYEHTGEQLLEISIRPYLYALSNKYGRPIKSIREIPDIEFNDWQSMGFNWIWLYGVWEIGEYVRQYDLEDQILLNRYNENLPNWTREDVIGYPLCIYSYDINPEVGTLEDLIWFREQLKKRGMLLMLDYVPNHTAIDAPEMREHPEFYIRTTETNHEKYDLSRFMPNGIAYGAGKFMPPMRFNAQLNLFRYDCRDHQINKLLQISELCDGVRVHLAQYQINSQFDLYWDKELGDCRAPPDEFWKVAIDRVRAKNPKFIMMGESYGYENQEKLLECGFNYIYEKELLDKLLYGDVHSFKSLIFQNHFITNRMVHFVENHDEPRILSRFHYDVKIACAASAALLTLPGIRLINFHQWLGYLPQIDVNLRRANDSHANKDIMLFYTRLFKVLDTDMIRYGQWEPLVVHDSDSVLAWKWVFGNQHLLVTINFKNDWSGGRVICEDAPIDMREIPVHELIYNTTYIRDPQEMRDTGLVLYLERYQTQVFEY